MEAIAGFSFLFMLVAIGSLLGVSIFTGVVAEAKGYSFPAWFVGGLFFHVIALIAIAGMPMKSVANLEKGRWANG